jgi:hypothetical protein
LLGKGPALAQSGSFYFIPLASLALVEDGVSDVPNTLIDELRVDNPFYRKSEDLLNEAVRLYENEEYDESRKASQEAQKYARLAEKEVEQQLKTNEVDKLIIDAESMLKEAEELVNKVKKIAPATPAPVQYKQAQIAYANARSARSTKDWEEVPSAVDTAKRNAREAIDILTGYLKNAERNPASSQEFASASSASSGSQGTQSVQSDWNWGNIGNDQPATARTETPAPSPPAVQSSSANATPAPRVTASPQPSRPAASPSKTPQAPDMGPAMIGTSPGVPGLSGSAPKESPVSSARTNPARGSAASPSYAGLSRSALEDNTPPAPSLSSRTVSVASAGPVNTPRVPAMAEISRPATAGLPSQTGSSPIRNSAIPELPPSGAPHISSSLGQGETGAPPQDTALRLAAQYRVQTWEASSDCLWNIAGKPWVYGDPNKWTHLYRANIAKLPNPQNPHLVPPNLVLDIPSINGEARQGVSTWEGIRTAAR